MFRVGAPILLTMKVERAAGRLRSLPRVRMFRTRLMIVALLVGLCMLPAQGTTADGPSSGDTRLVALADAAQPSFSLPSLDGPARELAQLRGQVVLLHFFATWCEPCRAEMASLRALQSRLAGAPFAIVPISVAEADGAVRRFFASESLPFAILLDRDRAVARAWNVQTHPRPSSWIAP
jgi:peroxiredoxin